MTTASLATMLGLTIGLGLFLILIGAVTEPPEPKPRTTSRAHELLRYAALDKKGRLYPYRWLLLAGAVLGLLVGTFTGWYAMALAIPVAAVALPRFLRKETRSKEAASVADLTAWVRALSGNLIGGQSGLEVAIRNTYRGAPQSLRPSLAMLIARLDSTQPIKSALRAWADELDDYSADLVASVLILEADRRSGGVSKALAQLAQSLADQSRALQEVQTERAGANMTVRIVTLVTIGVLGLATFSGYMDPYTTPFGQVVFIALFLAYLATLGVMRKVGQGKPIPRFLPAEKGARA
jgi:tight adherence protein B